MEITVDEKTIYLNASKELGEMLISDVKNTLDVQMTYEIEKLYVNLILSGYSPAKLDTIVYKNDKVISKFTSYADYIDRTEYSAVLLFILGALTRFDHMKFIFNNITDYSALCFYTPTNGHKIKELVVSFMKSIDTLYYNFAPGLDYTFELNFPYVKKMDMHPGLMFHSDDNKKIAILEAGSSLGSHLIFYGYPVIYDGQLHIVGNDNVMYGVVLDKYRMHAERHVVFLRGREIFEVFRQRTKSRR